MRRILALFTLLAVGACAVPQPRDSDVLEKSAISRSEVNVVIERYTEVRQTAASLLNSNPLSIIETGPALDIDAGSFEVSQRLAQSGSTADAKADLVDFYAPSFTKYPLWFVAVVDDVAADVRKVQVYQRESAVTPWLVIESPETLRDTELPKIRQNGGRALTVKPDSGIGVSMSPQEAADSYAAALQDPQSPEANTVEEDSFIQQMRANAETNAGLKKVTFEQTWAARPVEHVLRTADGGALAFVTLNRLDSYDVPAGLTITWPDGSPQKAFLSEGISGVGQLEFLHQVLLYLPPGKSKPLALGQFGGVVSAEGDRP